MATRDKYLIWVGVTAGTILIFYMFAFPKPEGCGCEQRRQTILNRLGLK